ncbi:hypothetical protein Pve01_52870 [Planomonospora venezuelensis]|nr:hypothetical protein Pve01_52870 [Planomonospora venezuelensis]
MLWYHDHAMGLTGLNVYAGLAGLYLVNDPAGGNGSCTSTRSSIR